MADLANGYFYFTLFLFFLPPEKREGGNPAEADQLLPALEEEVLQTAGKDPLLRQRLQGRKNQPLVSICSVRLS